MKNPTWSFSSLKLYENCPKKYYHLRVAKDYVEPEGEAALYGTQFHTAAENYIKDGTPLPPQFSFAESAMRALADMPGHKFCEIKMGLTEQLTACGFKDKDVWFRGVADLIIINGDEARVVDHKTGKNTRYADKGQLELMALCVFAHFPDVKVVKGGLLFVVCNAFLKETYKIENTPTLWAKWLPRYDRLSASHKNGVWNPNPSGLCKKYCAVTECLHNGANQ